MKLTIDFETRSRADLKEVGVWAYGEHKSTEILCLAAKLGDGVPVIWAPDEFLALLPEDHGLPLAAFDEIFTDQVTEIEAHNAGFEFAIWNTVGVQRHGWPPLGPDKVSCSMALASTFALPRALGKACEALRLPIQKDAAGQRLMLKMCKPNIKGKWHETPKDLQRLFEYCIQDVEAEHALSQALGGGLSAKEQEIWHLTLAMNARGVQVDVPLVKKIHAMLAEHEAELLEQMRSYTAGAVDSPRQVAALGKWVNTRCGHALLSSVDKGAVSVALEQDKLPDDVRRVLEIRQSLGKSSTAKYGSLLATVSRDGRLRDNVVYHGASTGRYAGKGVQLQNLPRPHKGFDQEKDLNVLRWGSLFMTRCFYDDPMLVASSALRSMLIAKPKHDLIVADYMGIEARNVMWAAGEIEAAQMFRDGGDIYCEMAATIYGRPINKKDNPFERQLGKTAILGCGYQMSGAKFQMTCANQGIKIDEDLAAKAVKAYRTKYAKVPEFWYAQENAAKMALRTPEAWIPAKLVRWMFRNRFLRCELPSGRMLWYYEPHIVTDGNTGREQLGFMGIDTYTKQWSRQTTFGGKLTENIISAISRDIMCEAMLRLEDVGYPVVMTVHDEIISEVPVGFGSVDEYISIMCEEPSWAPGCPIGAEGWRAERYKK